MTAAQAKVLLILTALVAAVGVATALTFLPADSGGDARPVARATVTAAPTAALPTATPLPTRTATPAPARLSSLAVRPTINANVRTGPGTGFPAIAVLSVGETATAIGRNVDASWLVVRVPEGEGWVGAGVVETSGDPALLPLIEETATRRPATASATIAPTATSTPTATATTTATPTRTPTPTGSATPIPFPTLAPRTATAATGTGASADDTADLTVVDVQVGAGGRLNLIIGNLGPAPVGGRRVSVLGVDDGGSAIFAEVTTPVNIPSGGSVNVELSFRLSSARIITIVLNSDGAVVESNTNNNRRRVNLAP